MDQLESPRPTGKIVDGGFESPFRMEARDQVARLEHASREEGWGIDGSLLLRLQRSAPAWPRSVDSSHVLRSFRVNFGTGADGVAETFTAHANHIRTTYGASYVLQGKLLRAGEESLRLLAGNETHWPRIDWVIVDLSANRSHQSIAAVRGPKSLASELLVVTWMFPDLVMEMRHGFWLAGYQANIPGDRDLWAQVPFIQSGMDQLELGLHDVDEAYPGRSIPVELQEVPIAA